MNISGGVHELNNVCKNYVFPYCPLMETTQIALYCHFKGLVLTKITLKYMTFVFMTQSELN